jgi:hypothetical protein
MRSTYHENPSELDLSRLLVAERLCLSSLTTVPFVLATNLLLLFKFACRKF